MEYKLKGEDTLQLWLYFQDKATSVKGAMFNTITWVIGFAAALLGFIFSNLADFDPSKATIPLSVLMILISSAGLAICRYAFFALGESAKHIQNNWMYADHCLKDIEELNTIVSTGGENNKNGKVMAIWNQLRIVVWFFSVAFAVVAFVGVILLACQIMVGGLSNSPS